MHEYRRGELTFDVIDRGPTHGPPVLLLHGFPQFNTSWSAIMDRLVARGYRCLAPNQRGYSPRARPLRRRDYVATELVADAVALIDTLGMPKVYLVGHDLGAAVAWGAAAEVPERLATLSALSVPHPASFLRALGSIRQAMASWYIYVLQLPRLPERLLPTDGRLGLVRSLRGKGQSREAAERDAREMVVSGALPAAVNWYRGMPLSYFHKRIGRISVPTMFIWSDQDTTCLEKSARNCAQYVSAEYRFEVLHGVSHWMLDECPDTVADLLLDWFASHPL
jgi:pimeloyl-ACP methyl ester carboxylesterase